MEFIIQITENVILERFARYPNDNARYFYSIRYKANSFDEIKQYMSIPMLMNKSIYNKANFLFASNIFPDVNANITDLGVHYQFYPADTPEDQIEKCDKLTVDASLVMQEEKLLLTENSIIDFIVDRHTRTNYIDMTAKLVYSSSTNHPYIVVESTEPDITSVRTIKEIEGEFIEFHIFIPNSMLKVWTFKH